MINEIVWRTAQAADHEAIIRLLADGDAVYRRNKQKLFEWEFLHNPARENEAYFWVGEQEGRIVAVNGLLPRRVIFQGDKHKAVYSCDVFVDTNHRRKGLSGKMKEILERCFPLIMAYGMSDVQFGILTRRGWKPHGSVWRYYFAMNEAGGKGLVKNGISRLKRLFGAVLRQAWDHREWTAAVSAVLPGPELDDLWSRSAGTYVSVVEKTAAYMKYRYTEHPWLRYHFVSARRGGCLEGLLVFRHHADESVIVDYSGPAASISLKALLVEAALKHLTERKPRRICCETSDPEFGRVLGAFGFYRYRQSGRFCVFSRLPGSLPVADEWFLMAGASDNDLLTGVRDPQKREAG